MLFQIALEKNPVAKTNKEACVAFAAAQDSLCYNFSFRGRWKWPQASRILEKTAGARVRATGVAFLCMGARDRGIWATPTAFGVARDSQETPERCSRGDRTGSQTACGDRKSWARTVLDRREVPTRLAFNLLTLPAASSSSRASQPQAGATARHSTHTQAG